MRVIAIRGIPGSGKTWICNAIRDLRNVRCIDTDDLLSETYHKLMRTKNFAAAVARDHPPNAKGMPMFERMLKKAIHARIVSLVRQAPQNQILIFAGITAEISKPSAKFFIRMTKNELVDSYRRLMLREFQKILDNEASIRRLITTSSVATIGANLASLHHIGAVFFQLTGSFYAYRRIYKQALRSERKDSKTRVLSQAHKRLI